MFFANLCGFELAVAVQFGGMQANQAPSPPFPSEVSNLFGEYLPTALVQCNRASRQLLTVLVPIHGVAMDTSMP